MTWENAIYTEAILPEHRGNPLIEALPKKIDNKTVIKELANYPSHDDVERELEGFERLDYLSRIDLLRQPLPEYLQCFRMIEAALKESYSTKNPFSPTTAYYLSYHSDSLPELTPDTGEFEPKGSGMTLVGISGVGKTRMIERVLNYFPQVIEHEEYRGKALRLKQLTWIKIQCSHDSSLRGLCHSLLSEIDQTLRILDTKPQRNIDTLLNQIERKVKASFVGVIIIDEMQNLSVGKAGGAEKLLNFLLNLINRCGVPILFCGNPELCELFRIKFRIARRTENGGFIEMNNLEKGPVWNFFIEQLWALQWTNVKTPLTDSLSNKLYQLSAGVLEVAVRDYKKAQELLFDSKDERITEEILEYAHQTACKQTEGTLQYLRKEDTLQYLKRTEDRVEKDQTSSKNNQASNFKPIIGDLTRPQHPEFADKIRVLQQAVDIHQDIKDPDLIRRAVDEKDPIEYLKKQNVLCVNPLVEFLT